MVAKQIKNRFDYDVKLKIKEKIISADTLTPVGVYLRLRDEFPQLLMFECGDYRYRNEAFTYICINPIAGVSVTTDLLSTYLFSDFQSQNVIRSEVVTKVTEFMEMFSVDDDHEKSSSARFYGYTAYDAVTFFDSVKLQKTEESIPLIKYDLYKVVLKFDHFHNTLTISENVFEEAGEITTKILKVLSKRFVPNHYFKLVGEEIANMTDEEYLNIVEKGRKYCAIGDTFQIVLSRRFEQPFLGDEFNVYRHLRSINPSPYQFYLDFLDFKIFGSSPETHLRIENGVAMVNPIAGTVKRHGDEKQDEVELQNLLSSRKENAEHSMLVDLARNDLSRTAKNVRVESYREVHRYSHLMHLVSSVYGDLPFGYKPFKVLASTFPAGTLSGAPKFRAMEIISKLEPTARGVYGGVVGYIGLNGDVNHAITIRSFFSKGGRLFYQAGAGVVIGSVPELELQEVKSKLQALRCALISEQNVLV
ncbi:MAG: anthranilate synthase component [Tenuifilum sp.]|uniref:anthranilate synthase component I family protein n=1 Tax=Tenuifilum sp. TaxID=2760880 RepID=UPI0024AA19E5|nr:anthranilate synthase component I family protein [Tenuifilum sp.]MDI3526481.1 anthranilate synthase component [Tenuifilum sp.]